MGDRDGENGLRPPHVREAGVAVRGRSFSGDGLGSDGFYFISGQKRAAPTLALVNALRMAHDEAHDLVLWPTSEE